MIFIYINIIKMMNDTISFILIMSYLKTRESKIYNKLLQKKEQNNIKPKLNINYNLYKINTINTINKVNKVNKNKLLFKDKFFN